MVPLRFRCAASPPGRAPSHKRVTVPGAWTTSGNETLTVTTPAAGTLYVMVHGYQASTFRLTTSPN